MRAHRVDHRGRRADARLGLGPSAPGAPASPAERRRACSPPRPTRSARRSSRTACAEEAAAAEIARQSDALKSALLESVSHDLRTPLATIRAAAGTMLDRQLEISDEDRRASALAIDREAEHLNRLVTNLLDLSRIEAGALRAELEPLELADAVLPVVARLADRLAGRTARDRPGRSPRLAAFVDAVFLDQVVTNLLENAAKYVPPASGCACRRSRAEDGSIRLTVEDSGPGVPDRGAAPAVREVLSGPGPDDSVASGDRGRPRGRPRPDRGDGRARRGTPERRSAAWRSTSTCPPRPIGRIAEDRRTRDGTADRRADDPARRGRRGDPGRGRPEPAAPPLPGGRGRATAAEALRRWEARRPDLVLLDLGLPDRDGLVVVGRIRREATTPIVILSARGEEATKVEALERGADDYVTKPFGMAELHARIRAALRRAGGPAADEGGIAPQRIDRARHARPRGAGRRSPRPARSARVPDPGGPPRAPRAARDPRPPAPGGLGRGVRRRGPLRPRLPEPAAPEARRRRSGGRAGRPHRHRAGRRLPGPSASTPTSDPAHAI